jgi:hypothetical protein
VAGAPLQRHPSSNTHACSEEGFSQQIEFFCSQQGQSATSLQKDQELLAELPNHASSRCRLSG